MSSRGSGAVPGPWREPVRGGHPDARQLARAQVIHPDGTLTLADVSLRDEAGILIAHGSSTCFIVDVGSPQATTSAETGDSPDPWERAAPAWAPGDDGPPPLERLTGLRSVTLGDGEATYALPAAARTSTPPGTAFRPVELKVNYLRPLAADGREAYAHARVVNAGRRFVVAGAEVRDAMSGDRGGQRRLGDGGRGA